MKKILMTGVIHPAPDYQVFLQEINQQNIPVEYATGQRDINLAQDLVLKILYPEADLNGKEVENLNNSSVVTKLVYKNNSFLFMGDAEEIAEQDLISKQIDLKADVLKVGHHGSKYSSSQNFLEKVKPKYAVIIAGINNDFGHPHLKTLKLLEKLGINILRTDFTGTIKVYSDGNFIKI